MPLITGALVFAGARGRTGPTLALVANAVPAEFLAVTVTLIFCPTSELESVMVLPVLPSDQLYEYVIGFVPAHVPGLAVSLSPCLGVPAIAGGVVLDGLVAASAAPAASQQAKTDERIVNQDSRRAAEPGNEQRRARAIPRNVSFLPSRPKTAPRGRLHDLVAIAKPEVPVRGRLLRRVVRRYSAVSGSARNSRGVPVGFDFGAWKPCGARVFRELG